MFVAQRLACNNYSSFRASQKGQGRKNETFRRANIALPFAVTFKLGC